MTDLVMQYKNATIPIAYTTLLIFARRISFAFLASLTASLIFLIPLEKWKLIVNGKTT